VLRQLRHAACRVDPGSRRRVDGRAEIVRLAAGWAVGVTITSTVEVTCITGESRTEEIPPQVYVANEADKDDAVELKGPLKGHRTPISDQTPSFHDNTYL